MQRGLHHAEPFAPKHNLGVADEVIAGIQRKKIIHLELDRRTKILGAHRRKNRGAAGKVKKSGDDAAVNPAGRGEMVLPKI